MSIITAAKEARSSQRHTRACIFFAWGISFGVSVVAFVAWGAYYGWRFSSLNAYQFFPLLGLLAYSLMWSHYIAGVMRELLGLDKKILARYFEVTSFAVLALICLHPGLLIYQRFRDGFGLPPHSYESYVRPGLGWVTLLGTASLLVFLAYEFHRKFGRQPWWHYVQTATDVAMLAIFYHGLRLGSQLQHGWFRYVWWFYGLSLLAVLVRTYAKKYAAR